MIETWTVIGILGGVLTVVLALLAAQHARLDTRVEGLRGRLDGIHARIDGIARDVGSQAQDLRTGMDDLRTGMDDLRAEARAVGERLDQRFAEHEEPHHPGG